MQSEEMNWSDIYRVWKRTAEACGHTDGLFVDVVFEKPELSSRYDEIHWWPTNGIEKEKQRCLAFWEQLPDAVGKTHAFNFGKGAQYTLENLWRHRNSNEHQAATFIAAFLFAYRGSSRSRLRYKEHFGLGIHVAELGELYRAALNKACEHEDVYEWSRSCTEVLPTLPELNPVGLPDVNTLIQYITERFYLMLRSYQPVRLVFGEPKHQFPVNQSPFF